MAQGKRVGIIYSYNEDWIGGAYYIQNLIRSLNYLPKIEQIQLHILASDKQAFEELKKVTGYPKMKFISDSIHYNKIETFINRVSFRIMKKKLISKKIELEWLFPLFDVPNQLKHINDLVFWIPDLQEKFLPNFFSEEDVKMRHDRYLNMIQLNQKIVFSSQSALNDFNTFYPSSKNEKKVLQFAVVHPDLIKGDLKIIKEKYGITGDYFFSPNQFWQHKNHISIIEAVKILKDKGVTVKVVFTGKEYDYRNPEYTANLKQKVIDYQLENEILFLGFIDRIDQLVLMKNAQAVIQPSLFEGWSTVVEDAKALNQTLIVSNIAVHQEQLGDKGYFFSPNNYDELVQKMVEVINNPICKLIYDVEYTENIKQFALKLKMLSNNT
ncbi:glycosyltransferase family 4 protein [Flavobacterium xueshanense]|uniref:Glycosyltransferase involved in cell wall bisynthesis n=1 Tax=Flavobacterium xueshanense TaxID=935223 RepID=A0A1I2GFL9_9FLAO|nr:glycosyltransferase family 1 protein [Flavobacterium xueshanense]SFF15546.1 Glycosyltransferase involved in cell wall bisynthesis [Flavobacterium xueshanense]